MRSETLDQATANDLSKNCLEELNKSWSVNQTGLDDSGRGQGTSTPRSIKKLALNKS